MKKLLPMILMLSFSLPAMAEDVTLSCNLVGPYGDKLTQTITFNEAKGTILGEESECRDQYCTHISITRSEVIQDVKTSIMRISRATGQYEFHFKANPDLKTTGTCAPFKQAF